VSVVVPCLNRARFIVPTIDSILQQDYPNVECIVIDGGSTDGTIEILRSYESKIKWISEPDNGHADAINKGWKISRGEILAWLNADDCYVVPDAISKAVGYLRNHPEVDVVYGCVVTISLDGEVISDIREPRSWDLVFAVKYCDHIIPQPAAFVRRPILEKANWLDPSFRYGKDHELWLRIGLVGTIKYFPALLAYERALPGLSQHTETSESKVRLTRKFFCNPNLPPPFDSKRFRRRAMSNAYLAGSSYAWPGRHLRTFATYLVWAISTDPFNLLHVVARALWVISVSLLAPRLPRKLKTRLKGIMPARQDGSARSLNKED
jgi:glycosyltransferase involved in cell wall biosynthesis